MAGVTEEVGKAAGSFMDTMKNQPLSLALVVMNLALIALLWYGGSTTALQRKETVDLIVKWQSETDKLMASCVSAEVTRLMLDNMQKITTTMLDDRDKEAGRMQDVINRLEKRLFDLPPPTPQSFPRPSNPSLRLKFPVTLH